MIELKDLSKQYQSIHVFDGISFKCGMGEVIAIKGKSGSGKSTLLNILAGLEKASSGTYRFEDKQIESMSFHELASIRANKIGYISQFSPMVQNITAIENIYLPLLIREPDRKNISNENRRAIEELSTQLNVKHVWNKKINKLSGGEIQRIGIIRALLGNPKLIIADEPTGSLDDESASAIMSVFKELKNKGVTTIIATHNQQIALQCDKIYLLKAENLIEQ